MSTPAIVTVPGWQPIMQVAVGDVDVAVGQAVYDTARYDDYPDATYAGTEALWMDDSCDVIEATTFYGRERAVDQFDVGTATFRVANPDGLWDYPPTSDATVISLRPGRQVRVGVAETTPGYVIPGSPYVPGYLTPTVGTVTTPDPGPLPAECVFVFKTRPADLTYAAAVIAAQMETGGQYSWNLQQAPDGATSVLFWYWSVDGSGIAGAGLGAGAGGTVDIQKAIAISTTTGFTAYTSTDGALWTVAATVPTAAPVTYDASTVMRIGADGFGQTFQGRIYSVELRTGLDPAAGTVIWRFDADDYPGTGTAYTDPRGRVWTLTTAAAITPKIPGVPDVWVPPASAPPVWLWRGWVDATAATYDPTVGDVVDVSAVCAKGEAGRVELARLTAPVGDAETVHNRMHRYCDAAAFPAARRQFDQASTPLAGTALGGRTAALMDRSARSAGGDVFGDQNGYLTYRGQDWQVRAPGPPDAVIGNRGEPGEVCPNTWDVLFNRGEYAARVNYGQSGGPVTTIEDAANRDRYGAESYTMTDLETVDAATRTMLAERMLKVRSFQSAPRVAGVTLDAARPGVAAVLAAADPFYPSVYSCGHVARDGRTVFARMMVLTGVEHTIDAAAWTARLSLDDATPWQTNPATFYDAAHYDADYYSKAV